MIIEILLAEGPSGKFVFPLRLVSKQLNALATPLLYRDILLNKRTVMLLVSNSASLAPYEVRIIRHIREYTQDVTLTPDLPIEHLKSAFESLKSVRVVA